MTASNEPLAQCDEQRQMTFICEFRRPPTPPHGAAATKNHPPVLGLVEKKAKIARSDVRLGFIQVMRLDTKIVKYIALPIPSADDRECSGRSPVSSKTLGATNKKIIAMTARRAINPVSSERDRAAKLVRVIMSISVNKVD